MEPTIAIIMFFTVASYMPITVIITEWRGKLRREVNRTDQVRGTGGWEQNRCGGLDMQRKPRSNSLPSLHIVLLA